MQKKSKYLKYLKTKINKLNRHNKHWPQLQSKYSLQLHVENLFILTYHKPVSTNFRRLESFIVCSLTTVQLRETDAHKREKIPKCVNPCELKAPRAILCFNIYYDDSQDSAYSHTKGYDLLQWKHTEQNQQRKRYMGQNLGEINQVQAARILSQRSNTGWT